MVTLKPTLPVRMSRPIWLSMGRPIESQIGLLILTGNVGFSVTILSYNKTLFFGMIAEPRLLPDVEKIAARAAASFDELLTLARERTNSLQMNQS